MLKITATVTGVPSNALSALREKRHTDGVVAMTEDEHQDLLELEREQAELSHAKWAAGQVCVWLRQVVDDGGQFTRGGNGFIPAAVVKQGQSRLDAAVELAADPKWVGIQLTTLRVKPRHMDAARQHLNTLVVKLIEREVGNGM